MKFILQPWVAAFILLICPKAHSDYGTSAFGSLAYPPSFTQFNHTTKAKTPPSGTVVWGILLSFNSLNPFVTRGTPAPIMGLLCFARLLDDSYDEIGSSYGYLAEDVDVAPDYTWVKFRLRSNATFSDGSPITADDVVFSFNMLCEHNPMRKNYYHHITHVEKLDDRTVIFQCPHNKSREIANIIGQIAVLPKSFFTNRDAGAPLSQPIPSSGPYVVESFDIGTFIQLKRRDNWWGEDIPSQVGKYNIERLRLNVFRDATVLIEALLSGDIDMCFENRIKAWEESYNGPAFDEGRTCRSELKHQDCSHTSGMFFNTRRLFFNDIRVRQAINLMINGPWLNINLYQGRYKRNQSYYPNSLLAHHGLPEGDEKSILEPYRSQLPESVWTSAPQETEPPYNPKDRRRQALDLLAQAGWKLEDDTLKKKGHAFSFDILINNKSVEKLALHVQNVLKPLGIRVSVRMIDRVVYQEKLDQLDFDMVVEMIPQGLMPGNEQMSYWGSSTANTPGTMNYAGIQNPVVDALCEKLLSSHTYEELCMHTSILDRVLMSGCYMIPCWHFDRILIAHKPRICWAQPYCEHQTVRWLFETMWVDDTAQPKSVTKPSIWKRLWNWLI